MHSADEAVPIWRLPGWQRERLSRVEDRRRRRARGVSTPRLQTIALVELDALEVPEWAAEKAVPGLSLGADRVWLRRIAARSLMRLDVKAGGSPRLTFAAYRLCRVCGRARLGLDAEARLELDRKFEGWKIPCGPDCLEVSRAKKKPASGAPTVKALLGKKGNNYAMDRALSRGK